MATRLIQFTGLTAAVYGGLALLTSFSATTSRRIRAEMEAKQQAERDYAVGKASIIKEIEEANLAAAEDDDD